MNLTFEISKVFMEDKHWDLLMKIYRNQEIDVEQYGSELRRLRSLKLVKRIKLSDEDVYRMRSDGVQVAAQRDNWEVSQHVKQMSLMMAVVVALSSVSILLGQTRYVQDGGVLVIAMLLLGFLAYMVWFWMP